MSAAGERVDTTVDMTDRVLLAQAPNGKQHWAYEGAFHGALVTHCWVTKDPWPTEFGSAAAITCRLCQRAFARQQQQAAKGATC